MPAEQPAIYFKLMSISLGQISMTCHVKAQFQWLTFQCGEDRSLQDRSTGSSKIVQFGFTAQQLLTCPACRCLGVWSKMSVIVHPKFVHTLPRRGPSDGPIKLQRLPLHILHIIASKLDKAQDLCSFEQVCTLGR